MHSSFDRDDLRTIIREEIRAALLGATFPNLAAGSHCHTGELYDPPLVGLPGPPLNG